MENILEIPEWVSTAILGAVIAALGYVGKLIMESWIAIREAQNARRARLVELQSLLDAAYVSFKVQNEHAQRLLALISESHPDLAVSGEGYDDTFASAYSTLTPEEKELHAIIRGITVYSLQPGNQALLDWLKSDTYFRAQKRSQRVLGALAAELATLHAHLILWQAKYEIWIPNCPEHALVYLADEKRHGIGFPAEIDEDVRKALA